MAHPYGSMDYVDILNNRLLEESLFSQRFYWQSDKMFHGFFQISVTSLCIVFRIFQCMLHLALETPIPENH